MRRIPARRLFAAVYLLVFCSQFSRYYTTYELEKFLCFEARHQHAAHAAHSHDRDHDADQPASENSGGPVLRHCKDTYGGIALAPIQPFGSTITIAYALPEASPIRFTPAPRPPPRAELYPPYQPPRA